MKHIPNGLTRENRLWFEVVDLDSQKIYFQRKRLPDNTPEWVTQMMKEGWECSSFGPGKLSLIKWVRNNLEPTLADAKRRVERAMKGDWS